MKKTDEQQKKALAENIWLLYYNQTLYEQGLISETERNRMTRQINRRMKEFGAIKMGSQW